MRYHLDTIPVWDVMKDPRGCPLCTLRRKIELTDVDRFLGGSVMEPDVRIRVNARGFCPRHQALLYAQKNRLGHALMNDAKQAADACAGAPLARRLTGNRDGKAALKAAAAALSAETQTCILCDSITDNMNRYLYTFLHLYKTDAAFREAYARADGLCVPDAARLLDAAADGLTGDTLKAFAAATQTMMEQSLTKLEGDLEGFTLKFDYRNADKPWGDSKGSLERTVNKLRGWCLGEEIGNG